MAVYAKDRKESPVQFLVDMKKLLMYITDFVCRRYNENKSKGNSPFDISGGIVLTEAYKAYNCANRANRIFISDGYTYQDLCRRRILFQDAHSMIINVADMFEIYAMTLNSGKEEDKKSINEEKLFKAFEYVSVSCYSISKQITAILKKDAERANNLIKKNNIIVNDPSNGNKFLKESSSTNNNKIKEYRKNKRKKNKKNHKNTNNISINTIKEEKKNNCTRIYSTPIIKDSKTDEVICSEIKKGTPILVDSSTGNPLCISYENDIDTTPVGIKKPIFKPSNIVLNIDTNDINLFDRSPDFLSISNAINMVYGSSDDMFNPSGLRQRTI